MTTLPSARRPVSWVADARKSFDSFPAEVRENGASALDLAASGGKADNAKPLKGMDGGIFELVLRHRGDAFRIVYAVQVGAAVWVIHAFQKKSKTGKKTPKNEIDLIRDRLKRLKEFLR